MGDYYGPVLIDKILKNKNIDISNISLEKNKLISVGSAMHFAIDGDVIW